MSFMGNITGSNRRRRLTTENERILLTGFFHKNNIGDDAFVEVYNILFKDEYMDIISFDNIKTIPANVKYLIIGGGDVITRYFMDRLKVLIADFKGMVYAISVGIPYLSERRYINMFDHVVLRSLEDINAVNTEIGDKNFNYMPDITWYLKPYVRLRNRVFNLRPEQLKNIAICLAQPAFHANAAKDILFNNVVDIIIGMFGRYPNVKINLISFNTTDYSIKESDNIINREIYNFMVMRGYKDNIILYDAVRNPLQMMRLIGSMDLVIGMRFHSIVFSMIQDVKFVALYTTRKVDNVLKDFGLSKHGYRLPVDETDRPTSIDVLKTFELIDNRIYEDWVKLDVDITQYEDYIKNLLKNDVKKKIPYRVRYNPDFDIVLLFVRELVIKYLGIDEVQYDNWYNGFVELSDILGIDKSVRDLCKVICYGLTNKMDTPYLWGLIENIKRDDFNVFEAFKWIYEDNIQRDKSREEQNMYSVSLDFERKVFINMNYMHQDNYNGLHRSGWTYVMSAVENLDASNYCRGVDNKIMVDMCVERTFMWSLSLCKVMGVVPYVRPWVGFIHHTFESEYSEYNCFKLLDTPEFMKSLEMCKGLIVMSSYLKYKLSVELEKRGFGEIRIKVLYHPTEFVNKKFKFRNFINNDNRMVIQIGAWLRNVYSIYALNVNMKKGHLRGMEMDNYFKPGDLFDKLDKLYITEDNDVVADNSISRGDNNQIDDVRDDKNMCEDVSRDMMCRNKTNKYLVGMIKHLEDNDKSVEIIDYKENNEFDNLLTKNIVFVEYVDVSASNTVLECMVRNTPIILNRHPALVEYLGNDYLGFYDNKVEAEAIVDDNDRLLKIYRQLKNMNKDKLMIEYFISELQKFIIEIS